MLYEFVEKFKNLKVGDMIKIKKSYIPPCDPGFVPVSLKFVDYIMAYNNIFTIRRIHMIDVDNAIISVNEIQSTLEYPQVQLFTGTHRIINSSGVK